MEGVDARLAPHLAPLPQANVPPMQEEAPEQLLPVQRERGGSSRSARPQSPTRSPSRGGLESPPRRRSRSPSGQRVPPMPGARASGERRQERVTSQPDPGAAPPATREEALMAVEGGGSSVTQKDVSQPLRGSMPLG
jgi:hypothetical protein